MLLLRPVELSPVTVATEGGLRAMRSLSPGTGLWTLGRDTLISHRGGGESDMTQRKEEERGMI